MKKKGRKRKRRNTYSFVRLAKVDAEFFFHLIMYT